MMEGSPPTVIGGCAIWEALGAGAAVGEAAADKFIRLEVITRRQATRSICIKV